VPQVLLYGGSTACQSASAGGGVLQFDVASGWWSPLTVGPAPVMPTEDRTAAPSPPAMGPSPVPAPAPGNICWHSFTRVCVPGPRPVFNNGFLCTTDKVREGAVASVVGEVYPVKEAGAMDCVLREDSADAALLAELYFSIGGGFILWTPGVSCPHARKHL
jgi:hypothetical protein